MVIYVDPKLIGRRNFEKLKKQYSQIDIVTDVVNCSEIEVLFTMPQIVKEMNISDYPQLKWIQYLMAGYDGVDLRLLREKNIDFCNARCNYNFRSKTKMGLDGDLVGFITDQT